MFTFYFICRIIDFVEYFRSILTDYLFKNSVIMESLKKEVLSIEKLLTSRYNNMTLLIGTLILFFCFKILMSIFNKFFGSSQRRTIDIRDLQHEVKQNHLQEFKKFENFDLEFKDEPQEKQEILEKFRKLKEEEKSHQQNSKILSDIFLNDNENVQKIANEAFKRNLYSNLLHPDVFVGARFIDASLTKLTISLYKGDEETCGITTMGGTESNLLAMVAYRNYGRTKGKHYPEILVGASSNVAYNKAGYCFGIKVIEIPLNSKGEMDINQIKSRISSETIAIVCSYPNSINGALDDVESIGEIALKNNVPLHVDCTLAGLLHPFTEENKCNFKIKGITSITVDYHRYGLAPYGVSVLLHSSREIRKHHYFIYNQWAGGIYPCPGFPGSRTAALSVSAYTVMVYLGKDFFVKQAKAVLSRVQEIKNFVENHCKGIIEVIGNPQSCVLAFKGKYVLEVYEMLREKNFVIKRCYSPDSFNLIVTNEKYVEDFVKDLKAICKKINSGEKIELKESRNLKKDSYDGYLDYMLDFLKK